MAFENQNSDAPHPLGKLPREDLDLILELVLKSGSLKELAAVYGVSYPTIRGRVDKVIERLQAIVEKRPTDPLTEVLAKLVERGELTGAGARTILTAARDAAAKQATTERTVAAPASGLLQTGPMLNG